MGFSMNDESQELFEEFLIEKQRQEKSEEKKTLFFSRSLDIQTDLSIWIKQNRHVFS